MVLEDCNTHDGHEQRKVTGWELEPSGKEQRRRERLDASHLHVALVEGLAQLLAGLREEGRERHGQRHHQEQDAHQLRLQDVVRDCLACDFATNTLVLLQIDVGCAPAPAAGCCALLPSPAD